jgi:hypothetical protein
MNNELNINANNTTNVSAGTFNIKVGKLSAMGVVLENVELNASATITDEKVKVECDFVGTLFGQLLTKFGDHINNRIEAETENVKARKALIKAEAETETAEAEYYTAQAEYYKAKTEKLNKEDNDND